jgi:hypothetical protein
MIQLKHILAEIGEATAPPYPYNMYRDEAYFKTQRGTLYQVSFPYGSDDVMEIAFATKDPNGESETGWSYDVETAESDTYRVMSTIMEIVRKAVDKIHPGTVVFGVAKSDPRRMRLYRAYMLRAMQGYSVSEETVSHIELIRNNSADTQFDWTGIKNK